jgi:hypothetical protein
MSLSPRSYTRMRYLGATFIVVARLVPASFFMPGDQLLLQSISNRGRRRFFKLSCTPLATVVIIDLHGFRWIQSRTRYNCLQRQASSFWQVPLHSFTYSTPTYTTSLILLSVDSHLSRSRTPLYKSSSVPVNVLSRFSCALTNKRILIS